MIYLFSRGLEPWPFPRFFLQKIFVVQCEGNLVFFINKKINEKKTPKKKAVRSFESSCFLIIGKILE